jgi:ABC-type branched-subunit amino acid transport system substrate-binding protein
MRLRLVLLVALVALVPASGVQAAKKKKATTLPAVSFRQADTLASRTRSGSEDAALRDWADRASLADLVFVLRHDPAKLAGAEPSLVRAALQRCPGDRPELRERLQLRLALCDPSRSRKEQGALTDLVPSLPVRPRGSVYRIGLLVPDSGSYAGYGRAVRAGLSAALLDANSVTHYTVSVDTWGTGDDRPARAARAADSATAECGALVGELLSVPTYAIATTASLLGVPLVSPTATDEELGEVSRSVFQIGPAGARRGEVLAKVLLASGVKRVGLLIDEDRTHESFGAGFAAAMKAGGAQVVWSATYPSGDFRNVLRGLEARKIDALFWDGESSDAPALLRVLGKEELGVQLVGGESLAPEQAHSDSRMLLEGVRYVGEDWKLPIGVQARLDSLAQSNGEERAGSLYVRGYLAGRVLCDAPRAGAYAPEEVAEYLRGRRERNAIAAARGFLDCMSLGAQLPVYIVQRGKAVVVN